MQRTWIVAVWFVAASAVTGVLVVAAVNGRTPSLSLVAAIVAAPIIVSVAARRVTAGEARITWHPPPPGEWPRAAEVDDRRPAPVVPADPAAANHRQDAPVVAAAVSTPPPPEAPVSASRVEARRPVAVPRAPVSASRVAAPRPVVVAPAPAPDGAATVEWLGGRVPAPRRSGRAEPRAEGPDSVT
jgi:hypothetical protein